MRILFLLLIAITSVSAQVKDSLSTFANIYIFEEGVESLYILQVDVETGVKSTTKEMTLDELFDYKDVFAAVASEPHKVVSPYQKSPHNAVIKDKLGITYFVYSTLLETDVAFQVRCVDRIPNINSFYISAREKPLMIFKKYTNLPSHPDMKKYGYTILGECLNLGIEDCFKVKQSKLFIAYR